MDSVSLECCTTEPRKFLCTWFGEVCSCCCLSLLPQLACKILATTYEEILSALYFNFSYYNIRGNIGALTSKNKQLEEVIASNKKENAAKRVEHDHRSQTANLFEEDLEHMNRIQTKATKVQLNTI